MPCVDRNGNTVPGVEGQCPIGSTFRRPNGAEIEAMKVYDLPPGSYGRDDEGTSTGEGYFNGRGMSRDDISQLLDINSMGNRKPLMDLPDWAQDMAVVGSTALGRGRGDKKALMKSLSNLLNKGKGLGSKAVTKFKNRNSKDFTPANASNLKEVLMNPKNAKLLAGMGIGGTTLVALQRQLFGDKSATEGSGLTGQQQSLMASGSDSGRRGKATLDPQHKSKYGGEFEPTAMQKLGANMKDPKWWSESISGLPSDTRLMRMGQLMDYYGRTPKGRAAVDMPSKVWAANEAASAKIQAAKDAAANKTTKPTSVLSKLGGKELDAAIRPLVEKQLGFNDYLPFNQASSDEVDRDVALVTTLVQQYHTVDGMPINEAIDKAVKQVKNTNIPIVPFF